MRFISLLVAVAACTDSWGHDISVLPDGGPPLGVGLVQTFMVTQELCESGIDGGCDPTNPDHMDVSIRSGSAASVGQIGSGTFELLGVAEGSSTVHVVGMDGAAADVTVDVGTVATSLLTIPLDSGGPLSDRARAFENATITFQQEHLGPAGALRAGEAPLKITSGAPLVAVTGDKIAIGASTGTVQIAAALATFELDVVDASALASFTVDGSPAADLVLYTSFGTWPLSLLASDAAGVPIVGGGPEPTFTIADPSIVAVSGSTSDGNDRVLDLQPLAAGSTTIQVTWGQATSTVGVSVVTR